MFSETRYAMNGNLRVAYRGSAEGERDIVVVPNWFTNCEVFPELPSTRGWFEAMASLGRLTIFDQPGTGASDPVEPGALPTLEQWADSITAVLDALAIPEAALVTYAGANSTATLFAATHPSRTSALVLVESTVDASDRTDAMQELGDAVPDMPWNEEIRAAWALHERLAASPRTFELMLPLISEASAQAILPTVRVPTLVAHYRDDPLLPPEMGKEVADLIEGARFVELPGRNFYHVVEPWRESFQEIAKFLTGEQAEVADDRVLATVLFTDIVASTGRAAAIGDRDWRALLDAHDAVVRAQLARFRGREVNTSGDGFLAMFDGLRGDAIGGIGVHIGARVTALAWSSRSAALTSSRACLTTGTCSPSPLRKPLPRNQNGGGSSSPGGAGPLFAT